MIPSINLISQLVRALSVKRAQEEKDRLYLGQLLHSIDYSLKCDWKLFCGLSNQYNIDQDEQLNQIWDSFESAQNTEKLSIMYLYQCVNEDNPVAYQNFIQRLLMSQTLELISKPNMIAYFVSLLLPNQFRYVPHPSGPQGIWYEFKTSIGIWQSLESDIFMSKIVSACKNKYSDLIIYYKYQLLRDNLNEYQIKQLNLIVRYLNQALKLMLTVSYHKEILTYLQEICLDCHIIEKLDKNQHIMKFTNGTYDLNTGQFKHHYSDDFCSLSTNFSFTKLVTDSEQLVNDFLWKVFPIYSTRKLALTMMSQCLHGRPLDTSQRKCFVWRADENSGCQELLQLFKLTLGDYCQIIEGNRLADIKEDTLNPYIELSNCHGARAVIINFDDEKVKLSQMIVGPCLYDDTLKYRKLYHSQVQMPIQFQLILVGNDYCHSRCDLVHIEDEDCPYQELNFTSKFVDKPTGSYEFKSDPNIIKKLPLWTSAFMSILLNHVN
jgi:hypothetical protein